MSIHGRSHTGACKRCESEQLILRHRALAPPQVPFESVGQIQAASGTPTLGYALRALRRISLPLPTALTGWKREARRIRAFAPLPVGPTEFPR